MSAFNFFRQCRLGMLLLFFLVVSASVRAQNTSNNNILISLISKTYDCSTGQLSVRFHIRNMDEFGNYGFYRTLWNIDLGNSSVIGRLLPSGDGEVSFTGAYTPGDDIICSAEGYRENEAPLTEFRDTYIVSAPPKPSIQVTGSTTLCNGASATLSVTDPLYSYVWSNGATGNSIFVNTQGAYTVYAINECGVASPVSDPVFISTATTPSAPVIGSSGGTLLCNGASTTFNATVTDGVIQWSNGASGASMTTAVAGAYYASATNGCGTSGNSNVIVISTNQTPAPPVVSSSNGSSLCNGASTTLSASPSYGGTISWSTGAIGNSILVNSPGNYYAYETNSCGTSGTSNVMAITTGSVPSAPIISSSNGTLLCNGASTVLTASGSGLISWNTGAVGASIGVNSAGVYYAVATNDCGTSGQSNSIVIIAASTPGAPTVTNSNGNLLCNGASTVLSTTPSFGGTILWSNGAAGNSLTVSVAGSYYAYESNGCGSGNISNVFNIQTATTPTAPTVTPSGSQQLCNGESVTLSATGNNIIWSTGAIGHSISTNTAGNYYAIDRNSCGNSGQSNLVNLTTVVCPTPLPGSSFFVCPGVLKTLDAGAGYDSYSWSNGATSRTIEVGPGTYTVTVSKQGCFATSAPVTVGYYTVSTPTVSTSGATSFCAGGTVTLYSSAANAYAWNNGSSAGSITVNISGNYFVTTTDANGCTATSSAINVTVHPLPMASITGGGNACLNGTAPTVVFTGSNGTAPYTFSYRINGGVLQTVSSVGNSVSVAVPTTAAGNYTYTLVSVQESGSGACSNSASGAVSATIQSLPSATISGTTQVCVNSASPVVQFSAAGGQSPYTFSYRINGGAVQTISSGPGHLASIPVPTQTAGAFVYSLVSVQEAGSCIASASGDVTITVHGLPTASITGSATVCQNAPSPVIVFSASAGIAPYIFSYRVNGGSEQTITTVNGSSVSLAVPTSAAGDFVYELVRVQESGIAACANAASGSVTVRVQPLPVGNISGDAVVCRNASSPLIQFSGTGGIAPYTFMYRVNGGSPQSISTTSGNAVSLPVSTQNAGSYTYTLISVQEASGNSCLATINASATVVVHPLPTASVSGTATVCQNATAPLISFTGANGTAPYLFTYRINNGTDLTISTTGNTVSIQAPTTIAGSFSYQLVSVQDASATACQQAANGTVLITVHPQPTKPILSTVNNHLCNGETGVLRVSNYVAGQTYAWFKDGVMIRSTTGDTIQVQAAGSYTVSAVSVNGCVGAVVSDPLVITSGTVGKPVITGWLKVCEGGKTLLIASVERGSGKYRWGSPPTSPSLSEDSSFFAYAGQYRLWVSAEGCTDSVNAVVMSNDTEFPAGRLILSSDSIGYGEAVTMRAEVSHAARYIWEIGDGRAYTTSGHTMVHRFYQEGDGIPIRVRAISARNCSTDFTARLKVAARVPAVIPNHSFSGQLRDWNVYPIPFSHYLHVSAVLKRNETVRFDLFASDGRWLQQWTFKGQKGDNEFQIKGLGHLLSGAIYYLTAYYNQQKHSELIVKQ